MASFREAFREAKDAGDRTFVWQGKTYSTKTAEEQGREIGSRAAVGSGRGASAGRTAKDVDTGPRRAEIPTGGGALAPAETPKPRMTASDIPGLVLRGMKEGVERVPFGRGDAPAFLMGAGSAKAFSNAAKAAEAVQAAKRAAEAERIAARVDPLMSTSRVRGTGQFRSGSPSVREAQREAAEEMAREPGLKRGGKVKTYAKGGSVRGAGCETRTKKTRFV